jgi:hypothetical protein
MTPRESSCTPDSKNCGITIDAHPGTALSLSKRTPSAHSPIPTLSKETSSPSAVMVRNGTAENDVTPLPGQGDHAPQRVLGFAGKAYSARVFDLGTAIAEQRNQAAQKEVALFVSP